MVSKAKQAAQSLYLPGFEIDDLFADQPPSIPAPAKLTDAPASVTLSDGAIAQASTCTNPSIGEDAIEVLTSTETAVVEVGAPQAEAQHDAPVSEASAVEEEFSAAVEIPRGADRERVVLKEVRESPAWPLLTPQAVSDIGGAVGKFNANISAIETLIALESAGRAPTDEERLALQRYTGWGGLQDVFTGYGDWRDRQVKLQSLITPEEYKLCRDSILNAHYTDPALVGAMWTAIEAFGFEGGRVLDPSAGTGHFFGAMPQHLVQASDLHAVELDTLTARIHARLYGSAARLENKGFEKTDYPEGWFDLAVSNVPFGDYSVACHRRKAYSRWSIHNYFLARMVELVRPGGIVAVITSSFFMDAKDTTRRAWINSKAKLLGAVRLPAGAFKKMANTDVVCDMLFFQRRQPGEVAGSGEPEWLTTDAIPQEQINTNVGHSFRIKNKYWGDRREMVVGDWALQSGQYTHTLVPKFSGEDLPAAVKQSMRGLPGAVYEPVSATVVLAESIKAERIDAAGHKPGSYVVRHGIVHVARHGELVQAGLSGVKADRVSGMVAIRDIVRAMLARQLSDDATEEELLRLRQDLNIRYDAFVKRHGYLTSRANALAFRQDPDYPLLLSLENYDEEAEKATKAAIFTERTAKPIAAPTSAESPQDAVAISMAEYGHLNPAYVAKLLGTEQASVMGALEAEGLAFVNPETGLYEDSQQYLSGNVRSKLKTAELAGPRFDRNAQALKEVLPTDLTPGDIDARLGVNWISTDDYANFIRHLAGEAACQRRSLEVRYDGMTGSWAIYSDISDAAFNTNWGTKDIEPLGIITQAMNGRQVTVRDRVEDDGSVKYVVNVEKTAAAREKQGKLEDEFRTWLWSDEVRSARLVRAYNDEFNSWVERRFDGSRLRLPGYSWHHSPSAHQLDAAARVATGANTLLAHCVGAGKTLEMVIATMEMRRLGIRKKILHVVPNHMLLQYSAEFMRAYPGANLLMASKEDLAKERRKEFCARIATGNWDAVVMTHSTFEKIPADPELTKSILDDMLAEIKAALADSKRDKQDRTLVKQLVKQEKEWTAKLERATAEWKKDDFISMADLGVDHLVVDEAHLHKNLFRFSQMERVAGLPNSASQRAFDMFVKTRQLMRLHGDTEAGVTFATGTPVANSMAELHVMQRYLQPYTLRRLGIEAFDSWAAQFGRVVTSLEVSPDGSSFRMNERFAQFVNLPDLMNIFSQVADIKTKQMLNLPTPPLATGEAQVIAVKPSSQLKEYIQTLVDRAEKIRNRQVTPDVDNMLAVTNDGRKAALDARLVIPGAAFDPQGKVAACVDKVYELWEVSTSFRGTQIVFCDMGTPGSDFSVYDEIKMRLIAKGISPDEIAFIHDAQTDAAKAQLFKLVREGRKRVLIASTQKAGVGTNVQTRLFAVHHLDCPWRPADLEQRDGRIERRGNLCDVIHIYRYVTEGSFDAYIWQGVAAKAKFIAQVMSGDRSVRRIEDAEIAALSYEEVKAIACGNPVVKEKAMLDAEYRKLCMLKSHHWKTVENARWSLSNAKSDEANARRKIGLVEADQAIVLQTGPVLDLEGVTYVDAADQVEALSRTMKQLRGMLFGDEERFTVGTFHGLTLSVVGGKFYDRESGNGAPFCVQLGNSWTQRMYPYASGEKMMRELAYKVGEARERDLASLNGSLAAQARQKPVLEMQAALTFEHADRLAEVEARLRELEIELGLVKNMDGTSGLDESDVVENKTSVTAIDSEEEKEMAEA